MYDKYNSRGGEGVRNGYGSQATSRRKLLTAMGASGAAALAGCTSGRTGDKDSDPLRIAITFDPGSPLSLWISGWATWDWMRTLVFDKLIEPNPMVEEPMPGLATEATQIDATTWRVTVRDGVKWHDGEPFTAEDVAFCYRYYRDGPHSRFNHHLAQVPKIENIKLEDDKTVLFETGYPTPTLRNVTFADLPVFSKHVWEDVEEPRKYTELPVGTGPYELVEYKQGERLRFTAQDDYWGGDPIVDEIEVPIISDPSTTFTALKSGEIDSTVRSVPPETLQELQKNKDIEIANATQLSGVEMWVNWRKKPFNNHDFRWALSRSVDANRITEIVMLGEAISGRKGHPHPRSPWTASDLEMPYRPEAARKRFDELGFRDQDGDGIRESPNGDPVSFKMEVASNEPPYIRAAQLLQDQWAEVGLDAKLWTRDAGSVGEGDNYDMYITESNYHLAADPDQFLMNHRGGPGHMWDVREEPYPAFEELQEKYFAAETLDKQVNALHEMHRLHMKQPAVIPLWYPLDNQAYRPGSHNKWAETPGFGIHHKWSLLSEEAREGAITKRFY